MMVSVTLIVFILMVINVGIEHLFIQLNQKIDGWDVGDRQSQKVVMGVLYFIRWIVLYKILDDFIFSIS